MSTITKIQLPDGNTYDLGASSASYHPDIFSVKWSDHLINDIQWLRADTFSWQSGDVYASAYEKLVEEYPTGEELGYVNDSIINTSASSYSNLTVSADYIASGFNSGGRIPLKNSLQQNDVLIFKIKTGTDITTAQVVFGMDMSVAVKNGSLGYNSLIDAGEFTAKIQAQTNTEYYFKIVMSTSYRGYCYYSTDGVTWYTFVDLEVNYATNIGYGYLEGSYVTFLGTVDLNGCYLNGNCFITRRNSEDITEDSITYRRSSNGFKITTADYEQAVLSKYNTDGMSWYYILDTENRRFKLPRTKFGFEGLRDYVGDDIEESLPNITGNVPMNQTSLSYLSGAFTTGSNGNAVNGGSTGTTSAYFNASLSSSTYQDNAPVQERATQMYLYFYVGEYSQTAIEQTAGITSEQLNAKVDLDCSNISSAGQKVFDGQWVAKTSDTLSTVTATGTYTINLSSYLPSDNYCYEMLIVAQFYSTSTTYSYTTLSGNLFAEMKVAHNGTNNRSPINCFSIPIDSTRKITMEITGNSRTVYSFIAVAYRRIGTNT